MPSLLGAIADPGANNKACLDTLLSTVFVNTGASPERTQRTCRPSPAASTAPVGSAGACLSKRLPLSPAHLACRCDHPSSTPRAVDAPSLALIVPVIHRGLRDRSGDVKKASTAESVKRMG